MTTANSKNLASLRKRWVEDPFIPRWNKEERLKLLGILEARVKNGVDAYEKRNVKLYYPDDCSNFDVFMSVGCALEARVIRTYDGFLMYNFGKCHDWRGIE